MYWYSFLYSDVEMFSPEVELVAALLLLPAVKHLVTEPPAQIFPSDDFHVIVRPLKGLHLS